MWNFAIHDFVIKMKQRFASGHLYTAISKVTCFENDKMNFIALPWVVLRFL